MSRYYHIYTVAYSPKVTAVLFVVGIAIIVSDIIFFRKKIIVIEQKILSEKIYKELQKLQGKKQFLGQLKYIGWALIGMAALNLYQLIKYG